MGRHSRRNGSPPPILPGRGKSAPDSPGPDTPGVLAENLDDTRQIPLIVDPEVPATPSSATLSPATPTSATPTSATLSPATPTSAALSPTTPTSAAPTSATAGNVLTRPAEPTEVIPRIRPDVQRPWNGDPDSTAILPRLDTATTPDGVATDPSPDEETGPADTNIDDDDDQQQGSDTDTDTDTDNQPSEAERTEAHRRRSGWVWAALAAFWLLALGAGVITLASLGAPHFLCTGSASTGLACGNTGTVLAAVLTVVLIVAVGIVSVLAIENRTNGRTAWRWIGFGVVALLVVASCAYLLIRTIGG